MKNLRLALIALCLGIAPAQAQTKFTMPPPAGVTLGGLQVVTTCGTASGLVAGNLAFAAMDTTGALCTNATGSGGGGVSAIDGATFTASTSTFAPIGGEYAAAPTTCADGKQCTAALTTNREIRTHDTDVLAAVNSSIPAGSAIIGKVGIDQTTPGTTNGIQVNAALPTGTNTIGSVKQTDGTTVVVTDPCQGSAKSYLPITATTSLVKVIATGVSAKKLYICQFLLTTTAANNVAVFEATTGTTCATSAVAVYGAGTSVATAANGFPFPANGGVSLGNGGYSVASTATNANDLCIGTSAATPLTGGILYVTQ